MRYEQWSANFCQHLLFDRADDKIKLYLFLSTTSDGRRDYRNGRTVKAASRD